MFVWSPWQRHVKKSEKKLKRSCRNNYYALTTKHPIAKQNMVLSIPLTESEIEEIGSPHIVSRSNYKMKCHCCGNTIRRGDLITQCVETTGMKLRAVVSQDKGYIPYTGARWVHVLCDPGIWTNWIAYTTSWIKQPSPLLRPKNDKNFPFFFCIFLLLKIFLRDKFMSQLIYLLFEWMFHKNPPISNLNTDLVLFFYFFLILKRQFVMYSCMNRIL